MTNKDPQFNGSEQPREGLIGARIEGKNIKTGEITTLAGCPKEEFRDFQAMAIARAPVKLVNFGTMVPITQLVGLKLRTTKITIEILDTGYMRRTPRKAKR
jgi:hypothetical protein